MVTLRRNRLCLLCTDDNWWSKNYSNGYSGDEDVLKIQQNQTGSAAMEALHMNHWYIGVS